MISVSCQCTIDSSQASKTSFRRWWSTVCLTQTDIHARTTSWLLRTVKRLYCRTWQPQRPPSWYKCSFRTQTNPYRPKTSSQSNESIAFHPMTPTSCYSTRSSSKKRYCNPQLQRLSSKCPTRATLSMYNRSEKKWFSSETTWCGASATFWKRKPKQTLKRKRNQSKKKKLCDEL